MPDYLDRPGLPRLAYHHREGRGPTIVFLPGYGSDMTGGKATALDAWAADQGRALLRFDYRGCGASAGVFGESSLADWRDDALAAIDALTKGPLLIVGSSMGGWLMLLVALARADCVQGLVGIAAAPDFTDWGFDDDQRATLAQDGLLVLGGEEGGDPQVITRLFWESGQSHLLLGGQIAIDVPVRLLHSLQDATVPPSIAFRLGRALRSDDVQTILVKGGDHRLSREADLRLLVATVAALVEAS